MDTKRSHSVALRCAEALARAAGQRIELGRRAGFTIDYKGRNDLVTNVDREVEQFIRSELGKLFPEDSILGEEFGEDAHQNKDRVWMIDPIDGTTNFSQGIPIYCVSIALQEHGETVVGVIYDPTRDELFSAQQGVGTHLNGVPLAVSTQDDLARAVLATGFPPLKEGDTFKTIVERMGNIVSASRGMRRLGSAALDLAYVAAGRLDGFWEYNLNPWDTAAGYLLVQEAGGKVSDDVGEHFTPYSRSVVATNALIHLPMLDALKRTQIS
jgi:myo-inositol-1(or 4)-monophosphatase